MKNKEIIRIADSLANRNGIEVTKVVKDIVREGVKFSQIHYEDGIVLSVMVHDIIEHWKDITGYEGLYKVSNFGDVKSLERDILRKNGKLHYRRKERLLKPMSDKDSYLSVALCKKGNVTRYRVSRLVCKAFHPNPENKLEVNHIDGNKANNHYLNLEWSTRSENQKHAFDNGLQITHSKGKYGKDSPCAKKVNCISKDGVFISSFDSIVDAANETNTDRTGISKVLKGIRTFAGGYKWEYATDSF